MVWFPGRGDDRGEVAVPAVILLPVLMLMIVAALQSVLVYMAGETALAAAQVGVDAASGTGGDPAVGADAAAAWLAGHDQVLQGAQVTPTMDGPGVVRLTVTGSAPSLVPGLGSWSVSKTAAAAAEVWAQ